MATQWWFVGWGVLHLLGYGVWLHFLIDSFWANIALATLAVSFFCTCKSGKLFPGFLFFSVVGVLSPLTFAPAEISNPVVFDSLSLSVASAWVLFVIAKKYTKVFQCNAQMWVDVADILCHYLIAYTIYMLDWVTIPCIIVLYIVSRLLMAEDGKGKFLNHAYIIGVSGLLGAVVFHLFQIDLMAIIVFVGCAIMCILKTVVIREVNRSGYCSI